MKKNSLIFVLALGILFLWGCGKETVNEQPDTLFQETADDDSKELEVSEEGKMPETDTEEQEIPETDAEEQTKIVYPFPTIIDQDDLKNRTLAVSVENGAILSDETDLEKWKMNVTVYEQELYDMADISVLKAGDSIEINGELVTVTSVEINELGTVILNRGLDLGGYELLTDENGAYYSIGYSDVKNYKMIGEIEFPLSSEFIYKDESDLDAGVREYTISELMENAETVSYEGTPYNTTIVLEDGIVTSMTKIYTP